jgi:hypothetical protein
MKKYLLFINLFFILFCANAQAPINDEPCGAIILPILESADACTVASVNINNATFSNLVIPFSCGTSNDVWFKFTPATGVSKIFLHKESLANQYFIETYTAGTCNGTFNVVNNCIYLNSDGDYELPVVAAQINYMRLFKYDGVNNYPNFTVNICLFSGFPSSSSKVGINTKFPNSNLDIAGNVIVRDSITIKNAIVTGNFKLNNSLFGLNKVITSDANGFATWKSLPLGADAWSVSGINILNNNFGNVGIGTSTPTSKLTVDGQLTVDQKNFGGYGGLLLKGNVPGNNYPNIAFTIKNNAATPVDVVGAMIQGDLQNNAEGTEAIDITFLNSSFGLAGLTERMRIKANGNVGIGFLSPSYKLHVGNASNGLRIEGPATIGGTALSIGGLGNIVVDKPGVIGGRFTIKENGNIGIGNNNPNTALSFPPTLGKKITLYPGNTGDAGFAVAGNRLQIYADNSNADVAIGYDAAGTFNEKFAVKANGALAVSGSTGTSGQVLTSNGANNIATWSNVLNQDAGTNVIPITYTLVSGLVSTEITTLTRTITTSQNAKLFVSMNSYISGFGCSSLGCSPTASITIEVDGVNKSIAWFTLNNGIILPVTFSNVAIDVSAGTHTIKFKAIQQGASTNDFYVYGTSSSVFALPL